MNTKTWMGGLLAAQLLLSAGLFLHTQRDNAARAATPLLDFAVADVDKIVINDNTNTATLSRDGEAWQLDALGALPANKGKINSLLSTLAEQKTLWPVVRSASGRERFEVSEEKFQRSLQLYKGGEVLGEYFFGTSPGFRRTHARRAEDAEVYALAFNNVDLPGDSNDWLDKSLLSADQPKKIKGPDFEISKAEDQWKLSDGTDVEVLNDSEITELVNAFGSLRVLRAEDSMPEGERTTFEVSTEDGSWQYEFVSASDKYYVRRSNLDRTFTISQTDYKRIVGKNRAQLLSPPAPAAGDGEPADANA